MPTPRPIDPFSRVRSRPRRLRDLKSVPVLPSLITLGNVFFGFLAMAKVADAVRISGQSGTPWALGPEVIAVFEVAALLVFLAMVFDALDGQVARMTNQTSAFGAQLDSLADVVTFGVAPAFIAKVLINFAENAPVSLLPTHPKVYYVAAAIYVLCAAMRLARFNVESSPEEIDHQEFKGLPTPGAAAIVCAVVAFYCTKDDAGAVISRALLPEGFHDWLLLGMPAMLAVVGLLMVSQVPYPHMFYTLVRRRHSFPFLATLVVMIGIAAVEWQLALLFFVGCYALSGPLLGLFRLVTTGQMGPPACPGGSGEEGDAISGGAS